MAGMDAPRGLAERVIDTKLIKGPQTFGGEKKDWKRWSAKLTGYVSGVDVNLLELMRVAGVQREVIYLADIAPEHRGASGVLYSVLNGLLRGDSYDILMNVEDGNGAEVWRRLAKEYEPRGPGQSRTKLIQILQPIDIVWENASYRTRLEKWEKRVED